MNGLRDVCLRIVPVAIALAFISGSQAAADRNVNAGKDPAKPSSAENAWSHVLEAGQPPDLPEGWEDAKLTFQKANESN